MLENYLSNLLENTSFKLLIIFVIFDTLMGILRAIKQKKINSCIGIDGMIRKAGMILSSLFLFFIDKIINLNLIGFIPEDFLSFFPIKQIGIGNLFGILFIIFESLSVLKNMYLSGIPIPKKLEKYLSKLLNEFTKEIKEGETK